MPAASATAIVSPMALASPRRTAATTPDKPAGRTIFSETSRRVAESAYAASLRFLGTARNASSHSDAMVGIIMTPMTIAADAALKTSVPGMSGFRTCGVMNVSAKKP